MREAERQREEAVHYAQSVKQQKHMKWNKDYLRVDNSYVLVNLKVELRLV